MAAAVLLGIGDVILKPQFDCSIDFSVQPTQKVRWHFFFEDPEVCPCT